MDIPTYKNYKIFVKDNICQNLFDKNTNKEFSLEELLTKDIIFFDDLELKYEGNLHKTGIRNSLIPHRDGYGDTIRNLLMYSNKDRISTTYFLKKENMEEIYNIYLDNFMNDSFYKLSKEDKEQIFNSSEITHMMKMDEFLENEDPILRENFYFILKEKDLILYEIKLKKNQAIAIKQENIFHARHSPKPNFIEPLIPIHGKQDLQIDIEKPYLENILN